MINFERYVNYICDNKITQRQLIFLFAVKECQECKNISEMDNILILIKKYKAFVQIPNDKFLTDTDKKQLIERGFIKRIKECSSEDDTMTNFVLLDKFTDTFVKIHDVGNDIWELYPAFLKTAASGNFALKAIDIMVFKNLYVERINHDAEEHKQVLLDLKFAIKNDLIKVKLENWVRSEAWRDIRKQRLLKKNSKHVVRHDSNDF